MYIFFDMNILFNDTNSFMKMDNRSDDSLNMRSAKSVKEMQNSCTRVQAEITSQQFRLPQGASLRFLGYLSTNIIFLRAPKLN